MSSNNNKGITKQKLKKKNETPERANRQIKSTGTWYALISEYKRLRKVNLERPTLRLGWIVISFPIFRQARLDFFKKYLQLGKDVAI